MPTPEEHAREKIDVLLTQAGWIIQDAKQVHLAAGRGVVIRNFPLEQGHGFADYLFYIDGKAAGVIEASGEGATLTGVEIQSAKDRLQSSKQFIREHQDKITVLKTTNGKSKSPLYGNH